MPAARLSDLDGQVVPYQGNQRTGLRNLRRASQLFFLLLWLLLFGLTRWQIGEKNLWPDLFLVTDPLVAALTIGAARIAVPAMAASLVLVVLTLVFGRFFCGWLCPLGTLIDAAAKLLGPPESRFDFDSHRRMQRWKYYLLALTVVGALFSAQWIYLLDPLVLLFRAVTVGAFPAANGLGPWPGELGMKYTGVAFLPVALLIAILLLTRLSPRFYCRYLCPLGAFYGLLSRAPLLRRRVTDCDACRGIAADKQCLTACRMGAVDYNPKATQNHECIRCFTGRSVCHAEVIQFDWSWPKRPQKEDISLDLNRRSFLLWSAGGVVVAPLATLSEYHRGEPREIVRPPRVLDEATFADQCVRCAMCVQACPTQTLQLTHLEAGVAGFWTPAVTPIVGGCIADCNACSVACPTGAIPSFGGLEADKWLVKMGTVVLEKGRCISFTEGQRCMKCVEICPTKAFVVEAARVGKSPERPDSVDYSRCVGCGLCEYACRKIVFGAPALRNLAHGRGQPTVLWVKPTPGYEVPKV